MCKDIKKALEHCIEWNCADCPNREELGSGETVCRGRLLPEVLEYVADLEAKLAESEKNYKDARELGIEQFHSLKEIINSSQEEIDKLKQQLAEKDKEISEYVKIADDLHKQLSDKCDFCDKTKDQDKILFAVEQLEKVKENIKKAPITDFDLSGNFEKMYKQDAIRQIDNQIKQLKGENQ